MWGIVSYQFLVIRLAGLLYISIWSNSARGWCVSIRVENYTKMYLLKIGFYSVKRIYEICESVIVS